MLSQHICDSTLKIQQKIISHIKYTELYCVGQVKINFICYFCNEEADFRASSNSLQCWTEDKSLLFF